MVESKDGRGASCEEWWMVRPQRRRMLWCERLTKLIGDAIQANTYSGDNDASQPRRLSLEPDGVAAVSTAAQQLANDDLFSR